jgi:hypothetical protein
MDTCKCMQLFVVIYESMITNITLRVRWWLHASLELAAILFDGGGVLFSVVGHAERGHTAVKRLVYHCHEAPYLLLSML